MGGAGVALTGDLWSAMRNPALLSRSALSASAVWQPGRYELSALSSAGVAGATRFGSFGIGAAVTHFGGELYRELLPSVGFGMRVAEHISVGAQTSLLCISIARYGGTALPLLDLGATVDIAPTLLVAVAAGNVTHSALTGNITDRLPVTVRMGACWQPDDALLLQLELDKDMRWPVTTRMGGEYRPLPFVAIRAGATTEPWTVSGGFGLRHGGIVFDYAYAWHPDLGGTHALGIGIQP
ncbi:MAG: hypothetical protein M5R41_03180 [Bacteroidia bacterium]|nr:hypothetical protein [Bacteroidia bacterium]